MSYQSALFPNTANALQNQISAIGPQDVFNSNEPSLTHFLKVYENHTRHAQGEYRQTLNGNYFSVSGDRSQTIVVERIGDLLGPVRFYKVAPGMVASDINTAFPSSSGAVGVYTSAEFISGGAFQPVAASPWTGVSPFPDLSLATAGGVCYVDGLGFFMIAQSELYIGNTNVSGKWTSEAQYAMHNLRRQAGNMMAETLGLSESGTVGELIYKALYDQEIYAPLATVCNDVSNYIPVITLHQQDVKLNIYTRNAQALIGAVGTAAAAAASVPGFATTGANNAFQRFVDSPDAIMFTYVILDRPERKWFATNVHERLVRQCQVFTQDFAAGVSSGTVRLDAASHPVESMSLMVRRQDRTVPSTITASSSTEILGENALVHSTVRWDLLRWSDFSAGAAPAPSNLAQDSILYATLKLNSTIRFALPPKYMREVLANEFYDVKPYGFVYPYSFSLKRDYAEMQPSGSVNMSQFDSITLEVQFAADPLSALTGSGITKPVAHPARTVYVVLESQNKITYAGGVAALHFSLV